MMIFDMAAIYLAAIIHAEGYDMDYIPSALPISAKTSIFLITTSSFFQIIPVNRSKDERT